MRSFLEEVVDECLKLGTPPKDLVFVLPSKRAGSFLKVHLGQKIKGASFAPEIHSIESFVEQLSGLEYAGNPQLLFELYRAYLQCTPENPDNFFDFSKWGQTLLQDFNEIDRHLINTSHLFSYLSDVKKIEQWTGKAEQTALINRYLTFWNSLRHIYEAFNANLAAKNLGYQGMVYKAANMKVQQYLNANKDKRFVFLGFNALNEAEVQIMRTFRKHKETRIFWDIDQVFLDDPVHDAGYFIRQYQNTWLSDEKPPLPGVSDFYRLRKKIQVIGVPRNVSQVKYTGNLLEKLAEEGNLNQSAVILGDEALLNPLLNAIPKNIDSVNITMGFPLQNSPMEGLFSRLFELYQHHTPQGLFYKDVLSVLSHPYLEPIFYRNGTNHNRILIEEIKEKNWIYISPEKLETLGGYPADILALVFYGGKVGPEEFTARMTELILALKNYHQPEGNMVVLEQLYHFFTLFNQLKEFMGIYTYVEDLKALRSLYNSLLVTETVDFRGEPLEGLQIMGMLESRNLDFKNVILTSVNEGVLPSGKGGNSFIPFDIKREFGLPTYKEKDAVYTYHFYRLLQRAETIYLLYNTEPDTLEGGEKSRLISQLLTDTNLDAAIGEIVAVPEIAPQPMPKMEVNKDADILKKLQIRALKGFSPTSLSNYIRNPIDFYKKTILGIDEETEVDEHISSRVFGTVLHGALEDLYAPFVGVDLQIGHFKEMRKNVKDTIHKHFRMSYNASDIDKGKNLIAAHVLQRYVERFLDMEEKSLEGNSIKVMGLEKHLICPVEVPGLSFPVNLRGIIDRIDLFNNRIRIIDYKTGTVIPSNLQISHWEDLLGREDKSKAFQLLCYAQMYAHVAGIPEMEAGIISFKNLNGGIMPFATKLDGSKSKDTLIREEVRANFGEQLQLLLLELFNPEIPLAEKLG